MPKLKPRFYSLSSSNIVNGDEIHLTVGVVQYSNNTGKKRFGVCSKWLDEIKKNQTVFAYFKRYNIQLRLCKVKLRIKVLNQSLLFFFTNSCYYSKLHGVLNSHIYKR